MMQDVVDQLQAEADELTETVLNDLEDVNEHWHEIKLLTHGRLKMSDFEDRKHPRTRRNIPHDDIGLSGQDGRTMLMKLNNWVLFFFQDPKPINGFFLSKNDIFYLLM